MTTSTQTSRRLRMHGHALRRQLARSRRRLRHSSAYALLSASRRDARAKAGTQRDIVLLQSLAHFVPTACQ